MIRPLTEAEAEAVAALRRAEKIWPETLWIFANSGRLSVMLKNDREEHAIIPGGDGMDPDYIFTDVNIEADGGDW